MTPAARVAAAIDILDLILDGMAAERALTSWARQSRFAGSKDRAAVRDHVFDALRCKRSYAWLGAAETGRGILHGACIAKCIDPETVFTGLGHAPSPLTEIEIENSRLVADLPMAQARDLSDYVSDLFDASLGDTAPAIADCLRQRAPVFIRVNLAKTTRQQAQVSLQAEGYETEPHDLSETALKVLSNARKLHLSQAYLEGEIELQDAGSQFLVDQLPVQPGQKVLDYCAGGGGKSLAMAARTAATYYAYDISEKRMADIAERAKRAGATISVLGTDALSDAGLFDLVLCDVPCSGSGSWRRSPEAKWRFDANTLEGIVKVQSEILEDAKTRVGPDGTLAYATCSLLDAENQNQVAGFLANNPDWCMMDSHFLTPLDGGDGFYLALMRREG